LRRVVDVCRRERDDKGEEGKRKGGKMIAHKRKFIKAKSLSPRLESEEEEAR